MRDGAIQPPFIQRQASEADNAAEPGVRVRQQILVAHGAHSQVALRQPA